jgi:DNA-binding transcriptional LysR family regulator
MSISASSHGVPLNVAAAADHIQMIKSLVQQSVGVAILSWLDVMNEVRSGELTFTKLSDRVIKSLTLSLCVMPNRQLSAAAALFLNRVQASFADIKRGM